MPTGSIVGDVYLVMQSGDVKRGAGQWLYLIAAGQRDSAVAAICSDHHWQLSERRETLARIGADLRGAQAQIDRTTAAELARLEEQRNTVDDSMDAMIDSLRQLRRYAKGGAWSSLLRTEDSLYFERARRREQIHSAIGQIQNRAPTTTIRYPPSIEAIELDTKIGLMATFLGARQDSTKANIDARFVFDSVSPGNYHVLGMITIGSNQYAWWAPVTVVAGDTVRRDLDNEVEMADQLFSCRDDPLGGR